MKKPIILMIIMLLLCGCSNEKPQPVEEVKKPATELIPSVVVNGNNIRIPNGYVAVHSPIALQLNGTEREIVSFTKDNVKECCSIRYATTTTDIKNIEQADKVLKDFNQANVFNSLANNTVANEIKLLNDENTYLLQAVAMDNDGYSYFINSFIEKGTRDLYSLCIVYKPDMTSDCDDSFLSDIYSDIGNIIYHTQGEETRLRNYTVSMIEAWDSTEKLEGASTIEHVSELTERELMPYVNYALEEDNGVFTFEAIEGAGKIILTDERFGERELLVGYGSINSPSLYEDIALVHNENIRIEGEVSVNLMRTKWKEN